MSMLRWFSAGEADSGVLRLDLDRRLLLRFRGSAITFDGGLLAYRELEDVLALTTSGGEIWADARTGKNGRHQLVGLARQSVFGRRTGYEDVNDAEWLWRGSDVDDERARKPFGLGEDRNSCPAPALPQLSSTRCGIAGDARRMSYGQKLVTGMTG
jgi:hypothetical protein